MKDFRKIIEYKEVRDFTVLVAGQNAIVQVSFDNTDDLLKYAVHLEETAVTAGEERAFAPRVIAYVACGQLHLGETRFWRDIDHTRDMRSKKR